MSAHVTVNGRRSPWSGADGTRITTNWRERQLHTYLELEPAQRADFDYMATAYADGFNGIEDARFFQFRGSWYDVQEFERCPDSFKALGWDGWQPESAFSAVLVQWFTRDGEYRYDSIVVGYAHW